LVLVVGFNDELEDDEGMDVIVVLLEELSTKVERKAVSTFVENIRR
jgi:hypothetical protein